MRAGIYFQRVPYHQFNCENLLHKTVIHKKNRPRPQGTDAERTVAQETTPNGAVMVILGQEPARVKYSFKCDHSSTLNVRFAGYDPNQQIVAQP